MTTLFLMSSLRSGSHMVRSMLRSDMLILDNRLEHMPIADGERIDSARDVLVPLKYGFDAFTADCLAADAYEGVALILHRRDWYAQASSLAQARKNGSWFGSTDRNEPVTISGAEVERQAARNAADLERISTALRMPHIVLAYEGITVAAVKAALDGLLGRDVTVVEPATVKIAKQNPAASLSAAGHNVSL